MRLLVACAALALLPACRGKTSSRPPLHLISDMLRQPKYRPEGASAFFADHRAMRPPVEGTVARGHLDDDGAPQPTLTEALLRRGHERFDIFCSPCHDRTGGGHGMVVQRGYPPPIDLHSERVRTLPDAELFHTIGSGVRNMPGYAVQIPAADRWAIVAWVRVLERSQHATVADVPREWLDRIEPEGAVR
jgi:mono/diheme cytochrome c family protein